MSKLEWDKTGERFYETGVDHCALYVMEEDGTYGNGVAWNGVTSISENPSGAEANALYADNIKYLNLVSAEDYGATIEAYSSPEEFDACDGSASPVAGLKIGQQIRKKFGLVFRSRIGNDVEGDELGYKLHIVYNCLAAPSERSYETVNDSPEAMTLSWELSTTPVNVTGYKPTAHLEIDSRKFTSANKAKLEALEKKLFGDNATEPTLPTPDEVITTLKGT